MAARTSSGTAVSRSRIFPDTDHAIEWAEDKLILDAIEPAGPHHEFPLDHLDVLTGFERAELDTIKTVLKRRHYEGGETVFDEGDSSAELFIIAHGSASVRIRLSADRETRLVTFSPGTIFGELALLDQQVRSANVIADGNLVCYVLTRTDYLTLTKHHQSVAIKLLANLARELSGRLRRANRTIHQLEN